MQARPGSNLSELIYDIRGRRVMLDEDLAQLYGVTTKRLNEQVRRNSQKFPDDFMFRLNIEEIQQLTNLRSQIATSSLGHGGRRSKPMAFTEHGALMLASVLNSEVAVNVSIQIVRAFVQLRNVLSEHEILSRRLDELEARYDGKFAVVFQAIRELMEPAPKKSRQIGF